MRRNRYGQFTSSRRRNGTKKGQVRKTARRAYTGGKWGTLTKKKNTRRYRTNTSRAAFTLRAEGNQGGKAAVAKFKKLSAAAQAKRFKAVGGTKALAAYRAGAEARRSGTKQWYGAFKAADYKKPTKTTRASRKGKGKRKSRKAASGGGQSWQSLVKAHGVKKAAQLYKKNPRRRNTRRRNSIAILRTNQGSTGIMPIDALSRAVDSVPLVGEPLAPYVAPLAVGAGVSAVNFGLMYYLGPRLPEQAQPFGYSIGGALSGTLVAASGMGSAKARKMVAAGLVTIGAGIDMFRWLMTRSVEKAEMEGVADEVSAEEALSGFGAIDYTGGALGALELIENPYGNLMHDFGAIDYTGGALGAYGDEAQILYQDASPGDAMHSGADFDASEGDAMMRGAHHWFRRFGHPSKRRAGPRKAHSQHAGKQGHRWGWCIKMLGFDNCRKIAMLPPHQRVQVLKGLREQALSALPGLIAAQQTTSANGAASGLVVTSGDIVQAANGADGAEGVGGIGGYGSLMYTGGGL